MFKTSLIKILWNFAKFICLKRRVIKGFLIFIAGAWSKHGKHFWS